MECGDKIAESSTKVMTWTAYCVALRVLSPIHIGWRKLGNLQQTRAYVTGRTLWGTLTARITREQGRNDYIEIGELINEQLAFTYFYPSTRPDGVTHWPWSNQWDEFAWTFLSSYASTALDGGHNAESGSLHETEFIAPYARDKEQKPVFLIGYVFEKDNCDVRICNWQSALNKLQIGGERSYGWGRVRLEGACEPVTNKCFDYDLYCDKDRPQIIVSEGKKLLAHTVDPHNDSIEGAIEPLLGRETQTGNGFGGTFSSDVEVCWVPGSKVAQSKSFQIQQKGIWRPAYP